MPHRHAHSLINTVRYMCRLLAIAFWFGGIVRASDAIRIAGMHDVSPVWAYANAIFGMGFFWLATLLWLEGRQAGRERDREFPPL